MKNSRKSIFYTLFVAIVLTILIAVAIAGNVFYSQTKQHLYKSVNNDIKTSMMQLKQSIYPFMEAYSINEYENLIKNELNRTHILAVVIEDYNMEKILGSKYFVGKIRNEQKAEDYDPNSDIQKQILGHAYTYLKSEIENRDGAKLGSITIYASDSDVKKELNDFIKMSIIFLIVSTVVVLLVIYLVIHTIVQKPLSDIIKVINNKTNDGIPIEKIPSYNAKELAILSSTLNNMINSIKESRFKLDQNIAFLRSYELALDESSIVTKSDLKGNITYANEYFYKISGLKPEEVIGKPHNIIRHKDNPKYIYKDMWNTIKNKKVWKGVIKNRGKLSDYWVDSTILPILDENENIVEFIAVRHDITKMIEQQEQLDKIAKTDTLTGLGSRYKLINDISESPSPALAIINIDNFSELNDFYGYEIGDFIIKQVGHSISELTEHINTFTYHLQGDEYVLFNNDLDKHTFEQNINMLVERLRDVTVDINDESLNFNFTVGMSFESKESILSTADMALKVAKRHSRDLMVFSKEISLDEEYENNIFWTKKIRYAIQNDNFVPVYQPIINNRTNKIEKYEALVRMQDDDKLVSPFFFLEISKKTKYYSTITKTMIERSFEQFKDKDVEFSINLTIDDILDKEIDKYIFMMLDKYKICSKVVFEVVESESIQNYEAVSSFINRAKSQGCKIAIDDFGTGYSNFEYLMKLSTDYIKIDGSLIKELDMNEQAEAVVSTIVDFAKKMGIKTIAEFVHSQEVLDKVKELGIDYSQGYFLGEPKTELQS